MKELFYTPGDPVIKKIGQATNSVIVYTTIIVATAALFKFTADATTEISRMIRERRALKK